MSSTVEKIKEKLDVVEVLSSYIKLEKAGSNFKAKCPFHNEKTPSFFVSPTRNSYYCFGCGAKGDIFSFVQDFEGTDFVGSLKILADRAGVEIERVDNREKSEKERLFKALDSATEFFENQLKNSKDSIDYLKKRGVRDETIRDWRIGFAPDEWRLLFDHLKNKGFSEAELFKVGLIKKKEEKKDGQDLYYDVFRGRIIFPIFDPAGRVIAFSGRILKERENAPKYLNSPETILFNKSEVLYGFHTAKTNIRMKDYAILVEGQMDTLSCHQSGFSNTIATSGTAFTFGHLDKIRRISNKILMAFDSDKAGFKAAIKSAVLALSMGMEVKIAELPNGSDPSDLIEKDLEKWKSSLKNSKHLIDFYLDHLLEEVKDKRRLAKEVESRILPFVAMLKSSIEQSHFVSQISKKTGLREEAIWQDLKNAKTPEIDGGNPKVLEKEKNIVSRRNFVERKLVSIIFWQESVKDPAIIADDLRTNFAEIAGKDYAIKAESLLLPEKDELIFQAEAYYENDEKLKKDVMELLLHFEEDQLKNQFAKAMEELQKAESGGDEKEQKRLLAVCQDISKKLADFTRKKNPDSRNN